MYLNNEHLKLLKSAEGKILEKVYYHFWVNKANPEDIFSFLEFIEFQFTDEAKLILQKADDVNDMIIPVPSLDIALLNYNLQIEFNGSLQYQTRDASNGNAWKNLIGFEIDDVLVEEDDGFFIAEAIIIGTHKHQTIIRLENDGLEAEEYIIE
ncbi:MAG: hypothetical protein WCI53_01430 [Bacteroidota bacterium]|jgi:hypothetical protein